MHAPVVGSQQPPSQVDGLQAPPQLPLTQALPGHAAPPSQLQTPPEQVSVVNGHEKHIPGGPHCAAVCAEKGMQTSPLQQPFGQDAESHEQPLTLSQYWPASHELPVVQLQLPPLQPLDTFGSQVAQPLPEPPQEATSGGLWQLPCWSQQPAQVVELQVHIPLLHTLPAGQGRPNVPHEQIPFRQVSVPGVWPQSEQVEPFEPHSGYVAGLTQLPAQQPAQPVQPLQTPALQVPVPQFWQFIWLPHWVVVLPATQF